MKPGPIVKVLSVLFSILAFPVFTFSFLVIQENSGRIKVNSSVEESLVFIEGINMGSPPLELNVYPGVYRVIVKAPGYNDFIANVEVEEQTLSKVDVRLAEGSERTKISYCDYRFWDSLSKKQRRRLLQSSYSSLLRGYTNIEVANFDAKIKKRYSSARNLFPFYSDLIKQVYQYTGFQQIITGYTNVRLMPELEKVSAPGKVNRNGDTLILSGVVLSCFPQFSVLYRLTDKKEGRVIFTRYITGNASLVNKEFVKALKEAVDTVWKK